MRRTWTRWFSALAMTWLAAGASLAAAPDPLSPQERNYSPVPTSFRHIPAAMAQQTQPIFAPGGPALPVFLNRAGGTYFAGWDNSATNTSSIVDSGSATVSAFSGSDAQWTEVLTCVQEQFSAFNVVVTDQEPSGGAYIEAVVGGTPNQVGLPWGVGGVAPIDPYNCNLLDQAVVYAFADVYLGNGWGGTRDLCETVTQEVAHAMSLDHVLICEDPMTYLSGCGDKWFQNQAGTCGEYDPRDCTCGRPSQNSVEILLQKLGASDGTPPPPPVDDNEAPAVVMVSPNDGDTFEAETEIAITATVTDDVALNQVQLYWANNDIWLACPGAGGGWSCAQSGNNFTWRVAPSAGSRTFFVQARDGVGNTTNGDEITVWMTEDGGEPPDDTLPPDVGLIAPLNGAELQSQGTIEVVASAADDAGIANVVLEWDYSGDAFGCPMNTQFVSCAVEGSTYTWSIFVGDGTRTFRARATDVVGNVSVTADRTITLVDEPTAPPVDDAYEDNDTWDQATEVSCGVSMAVGDLVAVGGDDDWFRLSVPADQGIRVQLAGEMAASLDVSVRSGPFSGSVLTDGTGASVVEVVPEVSAVGVLVSAPATVAGDYGLSIDCPNAGDMNPLDPPVDEPGDDEPGDDEPVDDPTDPGSGDPGDDVDDKDPQSEDPIDPGTGTLDTPVDPTVEGGTTGGCSSTATGADTPAAAGWIALLVMIGRARRRRR